MSRDVSSARLFASLSLLAVLAMSPQLASAQEDPPPVAPRAPETQWLVSIEPPAEDSGRRLAISIERNTTSTVVSHVIVLRREAVADDPEGVVQANIGGLRTSQISLDFLLRRGKAPALATGKSWTLPVNTRDWSPGTMHGNWTVAAIAPENTTEPILDKVEPNQSYVYAFLQGVPSGEPGRYAAFAQVVPVWSQVQPEASLIAWSRLGYLALIALTGGALFGFAWLARRRNLFIRRIAGVDAVEESIGRATEMGKPVLYVTGVEDAQDIQTITGLLILGHVAKITAEYDADIRVANAFPLTMVIAEEMVRQGYAKAGRLDAHKPENVMFITSEQFAFAAGVNGIISREQPATVIYFGHFYGESLMLAETGNAAGALQIAGTAELTQMPFFVAACDYTLIGEELYATSAYLTREPDQVAQIKTGDLLKVVIAILVVLGVVFATLKNNNVYPYTRFDFLGELFP